MKKIDALRGVIVPLITPFDENGEFDPGALRHLVQFLTDAGVHGLMAGGTTGESPLLSTDERLAIVETTVRQVSGRIPVIAQVGVATTRESVYLAREAVARGADVLAILSPYYYRYSPAMLVEHYAAVCAAAPDTPVFIYNIPQNTGNDLTPQVVAEIAARCPNIVGIKESGGDLGRCVKLLDVRDRFQVLIGNDEMALPALTLGVSASVSGNANVYPELFVAMDEAFWRGDQATAQEYQRRIRSVCAILRNGGDLSLFKAMLARRGIPVGGVRPPLQNASAAEVESCVQRLAALDLVPQPVG